MPNAICDLVLYLQSEGLKISWIYPGAIPFQYLETIWQYSNLLSLAGGQMDRYEISETNLGKNE